MPGCWVQCRHPSTTAAATADTEAKDAEELDGDIQEEEEEEMDDDDEDTAEEDESTGSETSRMYCIVYHINIIIIHQTHSVLSLCGLIHPAIRVQITSANQIAMEEAKKPHAS